MTAKSKSEWDGCKIQVKKMSLSEIRDRWTFEQRSLQALEKKYHDLVSGITSVLHKVDA